MDHHFVSTGKLWRRSEQEKASWYFVSIEPPVSQKIKALSDLLPRKGWGSVKVKARIGRYSRDTSMFPDKKSGVYVLPIKATIRKEFDIKEGDSITVHLELV